MSELEDTRSTGKFPEPVEQFLSELRTLTEDQARVIDTKTNALRKRLRSEGKRNEFKEARKRAQFSASVQSRLDKLVNRAVREAGLFEMFEGPDQSLMTVNVHDSAQICARGLLGRDKLSEEEFTWLVHPFQEAGLSKEIFLQDS